MSADWVPLIQTALWIALIVTVLVIGRDVWSAVADRVKQGDDFAVSAGGVSASMQSKSAGLTQVTQPIDTQQETPNTSALADRRAEIGRKQRGVHLVHVVAPSNQPGQVYDIAAYLYRPNHDDFNDPTDLSDIEQAEFSLGPKFVPSDFTVTNHDGHIGITTSMYAPALCVCRVTFTDGSVTELSRYLDFESGELVRDALAPG